MSVARFVLTTAVCCSLLGCIAPPSEKPPAAGQLAADEQAAVDALTEVVATARQDPTDQNLAALLPYLGRWDITIPGHDAQTMPKTANELSGIVLREHAATAVPLVYRELHRIQAAYPADGLPDRSLAERAQACLRFFIGEATNHAHMSGSIPDALVAIPFRKADGQEGSLDAGVTYRRDGQMPGHRIHIDKEELGLVIDDLGQRISDHYPSLASTDPSTP